MKLFLTLLFVFAAATLSGCAAVAVGGAVAGGATVAMDRRPPDVMATDERLEWTAQNRIEEKFKDQVHVNAISFNRNVLLIGEALTEAIKADCTKITQGIDEVKTVTNEMSIGAPSSMTARASDSYITSQVKARLVGEYEKVNPEHVKVATEAGVVYLMGLVTKSEAAVATKVARTTSGVKRVVRVFEYIPDSKATPPKPPPKTSQ
jgi:osmotically-inducible protein OsmY